MSNDERGLLGPPPVEPMTNAAWTRVERGLFEKLDAPAPRAVYTPPPRARWPWLVAIPAVAAAAIAIVFAMRSTPNETPVIGQHDTVDAQPSRVVAGDTPSSVTFGDAHLTVAAHAAIQMSREAASPSVLVERGAVDFTVAPRETDPFVVRAGDVVVRVVGTQFTVARYEEHITVGVERGIVDVQFRGEVHRLTAKQSWSSLAPKAVETTASAALPPQPVADPVDEPIDTPTEEPKPFAPTKGTKPAKLPQPTDADRAKYEQLALMERSAPQEAIKGYLELSKKSEWAEVALYAAGRLAFDRGDARARTFLSIYLKRFPRGVNAKDARDLLTRLDGAKK